MNKAGNVKHGLHGTLTYWRWRSMMQRCTYPKYHAYKHYGGRGICVAEPWKNFEGFLLDMGECPDASMTLERLNSDKNYEPGNCRWATMAEQNRNRSYCKNITHNGQTKLIVDWAKEIGMSANTLAMRLRAGWSVERALTEPLKAKPTVAQCCQGAHRGVSTGQAKRQAEPQKNHPAAGEQRNRFRWPSD